MTKRSRPAAVGLAAILLALLVGGCSANTSASTTSTPSSTTLLITTTTVHYVPTYVSVGGREVLMPTEEHHEPITAYSGFGQNIILATGGFAPDKLYAASTAPIVFTNLTNTTQEVVFYDFPNVANSGPIPPGRSWSLHYAAAIALLYGNRSGSETGHLYIGGCPPTCG